MSFKSALQYRLTVSYVYVLYITTCYLCVHTKVSIQWELLIFKSRYEIQQIQVRCESLYRASLRERLF